MIVFSATWNESGADDKEFLPFFKLSVYMFTCNKDFLYFSITCFPLFNVIVSIVILSYVNSNLHVPTIYTLD